MIDGLRSQIFNTQIMQAFIRNIDWCEFNSISFKDFFNIALYILIMVYFENRSIDKKCTLLIWSNSSTLKGLFWLKNVYMVLNYRLA